MRSLRPAPRSTSSSIIRATLLTAVGFAGVAALLVATRDTSPTNASGTSVPTTGSTQVGAPAGPAGPASSTPPATVKKRTTTTTSPTPTTTAKKRQPTTTGPIKTPTTPEGFARGLYAAWADGSRSAASAVATPGAVARLFDEAPAPVRPYEFSGCTGAAGSEVCRFAGADGHTLEMKVRTGTGGLPMIVTEVRFPPPGE